MGQIVLQANLEGLRKIQKMEEDLIREVSESDRMGTLAHRILILVAHKSYAQALNDLQEYVKFRSKDYSAFYLASHRYVIRMQNIISAIEKQRGVKGIENFTESKKHEVFEVVKDYFKELRNQIRGIESAEHSLKVEDVRSTVWVVWALTYSMVGIFVLALILDLASGSFLTLYLVLKDTYLQACTWIIGLL
ncbi:MAG: hypothetical protein SGJ18_07350 [Pseudomonadota bacterium]|nr:hypothetical protein [Pseudomonadota bacterium]